MIKEMFIKSFYVYVFNVAFLCRLVLKKHAVPHLSNPHDVLIQVKAASVNPMDVRMIGELSAHYYLQREFTYF